MNIYEFAQKMEKDGEEFYRMLAKRTNNTGLQYILNMLAEAEVKHYHTFQQMQAEEKNLKFVDSDVLAGAKNIFVQMQEKKERFLFSKSQIDWYKKAYEIEEKSYRFYLEKADEMQNDFQKEIFLKIAEEERQHKFLIQNIIDFVSRPQTWIENAEFNHLDEY